MVLDKESMVVYQTTPLQRKKIKNAQQEIKSRKIFTQEQIDGEFEKWARE